MAEVAMLGYGGNQMKTETEWLSCDTPTLMLAAVRETLSCRKDRLLAVAICRQIDAQGLDERCRHTIQIAEAFADENATMDQLRAAYVEAVDVQKATSGDRAIPNAQLNYAQTLAADAVRLCSEPDRSHVSILTLQRALSVAAYRSTIETDNRSFILLVHDIVGNPFREVKIERRWLTSTVIDLANAIYEGQAFDRVPILADALMDAGCNSKAIVEHCRGPGPHVRGCWTVDLLLEKR
jgi:hypothetical protein